MTLKTQVQQILIQFEQARNSDIFLMTELWKKYYPEMIKKNEAGILHIALASLYDLPREDNIKRVRAHYQNDKGLYLPTYLEVVKQRKINEEKWRTYMSTLSEHRRI